MGVEYAAAAALRDSGLVVDRILFDGALHRCPTKDKPHSKNGAYIAFDDPPASVWWQNWRSGDSGTWTAKSREAFTPEEHAALTRRMDASRKAREKEEAARHAEAAATAQRIHAAAADCVEHPYLTAKGVKAAPGLKQDGNDRLIVPLYDESGARVSLQFMDAQGDKRFLTGGQKKGCFFLLACSLPGRRDARQNLAGAATRHRGRKRKPTTPP